jgi:endo-1,4-beta-xylanase
MAVGKSNFGSSALKGSEERGTNPLFIIKRSGHHVRRTGLMRQLFVSFMVCVPILYGSEASVRAETSIAGGNLVYKSAASATLSQTGYVGTYLVVPAGGATVNFDVNATGAAGNMNLVIANSSFNFNVTGGSAADYDTQNVTLPAGTYFVRAERHYDNGVNQSFSVNNLSVNTVNPGSNGGATFSNLSPTGSTASAAAAEAMAAATTYIDNYREGAMNLTINGVAPGTPIEIKEVNSAFKWGTNVPDNVSTFLGNTTYTTALKQNFNSITPENAGKWSESSTTSQLANLDKLLNFASQNDIRVRGHNLVWGSQQPTAVNTDFTNARSTNPTTAAAGKAAITAAITARIASYVSGANTVTAGGAARATQYAELDVYNEDYHTGAAVSASTGENYWQVMGAGTAAGGAAWTAGLYNQVKGAVTAAGANTELFTNEYNVLNNNTDRYGNFYTQNIESIRNAGGAVNGIGSEWYNTPGVGQGSSQVDPARAYAALQNLSTEGLPIEITEFGETAVAGADEATALTTAMTLAFGTQRMTGFTLWGFYNTGSVYVGSAGSVLYNADFSLTAAGVAYQALMKSWTTDAIGTVGANGVVSLPGNAFYGDYEAIVDGQTFHLTFDPSTGSYVLNLGLLGDADGDGKVDLDDLNIVLNNLGQTTSDRTKGNFDGAATIDLTDLNAVLNALGTTVSGNAEPLGGGTTPSPEPAALFVLAPALALVLRRKR